MLICLIVSEWKDNVETPVLYFILHLGSLAKSHRDFTVSDQSKHHKGKKKPIMNSVYWSNNVPIFIILNNRNYM